MQLKNALSGLTQAGHTVVVIEHHLDLIATADWVIDLGPGPGRDGGCIVVEGSPSHVAICEVSQTGIALRTQKVGATDH